MAKTTHTPGPWDAQTAQPHVTRAWHVRNRDIGRGVCDLSPAKWEDTSDAETEANARLIAAAPELLDALLAVLRHEGERDVSGVGMEFDSTALESAKVAAYAAIAKAEGK
jgi:hypothetical protein